MKNRFKLVFITVSACLAALLLVGAQVGGSNSPGEGAYRQMAVFTEVLHRIKSDYVEEPDLKSVTLGALNGLLEAIDPFASYLNAEQYNLYLKQQGAAKADVGLVLAKRFGYLTVVGALAGSPAAKAGLTTGDLIESIQGVATRDMPLAYAELLLRGDPGTTVEVTMLRVGGAEPLKIALTRARIEDPPLAVQMLPDQIGYVRPQSLSKGKAHQVARALERLQSQGAKGLILDLRQCAVGSAEEGILLADLFLDKGLMTYLEGQKVPRQNFEASPKNTVWRLPVVVTTNRGTADGAEIAAAALLENKRAEVVGERTFGDAALRRAITMQDGGAIILSVAKYYSPRGKAIQDTGVVPSVPYVESEPFVELEEEQAPEQPAAPAPAVKPEEDNLLKKAIEVLKSSAPAQAARILPRAAPAAADVASPRG
ncbi:MAG: S41 family peptidase [Bryobacterales bacterium]|nr:S41 family peptidase [Bryobacteraceae bacterium]MDW8355754.1 S41 family peptidase [Bryobacterales bacterium]